MTTDRVIETPTGVSGPAGTGAALAEPVHGAPIGESFAWSGGVLRHEIACDDARICATMTASHAPPGSAAKDAWWAEYLRGERPAAVLPSRRQLRVADLFSGIGGLALGLRQLLDESGTRATWELVVDRDPGATAVYAGNHEVALASNQSVAALVDYRVSRTRGQARFVYPPELLDEEIASSVAGVDMVIAGPPCEGHSNLNNRTRRDDPRNHLYLAVPAFAVAAGARMLVIENVPAVRNDWSGVVGDAEQVLQSEGYRVERGVLAADHMGWPQTRRRFFLVARRGAPPIPLDRVREALSDRPPRDLRWAIGDLGRPVSDPMHQVGILSDANKARIAWLFENDKHDLDLSERPECHRDGTSYQAVYGRLHWDRPAPTITTGFLTPGRGRYVHPGEQRTLTPREAARLQGFPDSYRFVIDPENPPGRVDLARWIGDAVPMPLGYAAALSVLGPDAAD